MSPEAIDAIVLATSSPDQLQPATATRIQHLLGAKNAFAFDINSVCSGSIYGLMAGHSLIAGAQCKNVLVVGADIYSRFLNPDDFSTFPYFGDGAGAVLLQACEPSDGFLEFSLGTDGSRASVIEVPAGGARVPGYLVQDRRQFFFRMKGKDVFSFAVEKGAEVVTSLLRQSHLREDQIALIVPHQANQFVIEGIANRCGIPLSKFFTNLHKYGNTAAASVFIALDEALKNNRVKVGEHIILVAFGGGLSWGGVVMKY